VCAKLALIPVVFDHDSDVPFSVIKALLSHALAYVLAGIMLGLIVRYGRPVFAWSWLHVPVAVFLLVNIAAAVFAVDPLLALYGAHTRMIGLGTIADCVLLYFAIPVLVRAPKELLALAISFLAGSVVALFYELAQFLGKDPLTWASDPTPRPFSTIGQTTSLAVYLSVVAVGAAALAAFQGVFPGPIRVLLVAYSAFAFAGVVATQTRSAIVGLAAGGVLLLALTWASHPSPKARIASVGGAAASAAVLAVVLFLTPLGTRLLSTVETSVAAEGESGIRLEESADTRIALYQIALDMVRDRPVLGQGPDNFLAALPRYRSDAEPYEVQDNPTSSAHSWFAHVAATSGVAGLAAFIAIAIVGVVLTLRSGFRPEAWAALGMLGAFLGSGLTSVNAVATDWLFWAAVGVIASTTSPPFAGLVNEATEVSRAKMQRSKRAAERKSTTQMFVSYVCVGLGFAAAFTTLSAVDASRAARASQLARLQGQNQVAVESGLRATRLDALRPQYWDTLGLAYVSADQLGAAASAFERATKLAPYDVRYVGDLARALAAQVLKGDKTLVVRATEAADRAVRSDPNNPLAHQTRAVVMQVTGDLQEALKSSERALSLDRTSSAGFTDNRDIYLTGVQVLNALGRSSDAATLARRGVARLPSGAAQVPMRVELARSLLANGQPSEALTEVNVALGMRPNDSDALQVRAQIQAALGN